MPVAVKYNSYTITIKYNSYTITIKYNSYTITIKYNSYTNIQIIPIYKFKNVPLTGLTC